MYTADFSGESNIARGKPTRQSSQYQNGPDISNRAVDGNKSPLWNDGSCSHSNKQSKYTVVTVKVSCYKYCITQILTFRYTSEEFELTASTQQAHMKPHG